jgi:hypothetical protein
VLGTAVGGEIEHGPLEVRRQPDVAIEADHLVLLGLRAHRDLAGRRDDERVAEHAEAVLEAALGGLDEPGGVLERHRLRHDEVVVHPERRRLGVVQVLGRSVEAERHDLCALQRQHAERLGPAAVVADQHAGNRVQVPPDAKAQVADLEVLLLEVLERGLGLVVGVPGQVDLAVLADDRAVGRDQDRGVEAARAARFLRELGVADVEADAELLCLVEQRLRLGRGHRGLEVPAVHLGLVLHPPARKEGGEGELREDHELRAHGMRLAQQRHEALGGGGARVGAMERAQLGGGDLQVSAHRARGVLQDLSWAISGTSRPSGSSASEGSRARKRPRPRSARSAPSSTITSPRESTITGQPVSSRPL